MRQKIFFSFLLWGIPILSLFCQVEKTLFGKSDWRISGLWGGPSINIGQINDDMLMLRGGFGAIEFGKRLLIGWAGYERDTEMPTDANENNALKIDYSGLLLAYTPNAHKVVHPSFSILTGKGSTQEGNNTKNNIWVLQSTAGLEINVFRWFHLNLDGGYRFITEQNKSKTLIQNLSGPFAEIKMKFGFSW